MSRRFAVGARVTVATDEFADNATPAVRGQIGTIVKVWPEGVTKWAYDVQIDGTPDGRPFPFADAELEPAEPLPDPVDVLAEVIARWAPTSLGERERRALAGTIIAAGYSRTGAVQ